MRVQRVATQHKANPQTPPDPVLLCANPVCDVEFIPRRKWQKYHSASCRFRHWNRRTKPAPSQPQTEGPVPPLPGTGGTRRLVIYCVVELG